MIGGIKARDTHLVHVTTGTIRVHVFFLLKGGGWYRYRVPLPVLYLLLNYSSSKFVEDAKIDYKYINETTNNRKEEIIT
jgi:hypothetical protein